MKEVISGNGKRVAKNRIKSELLDVEGGQEVKSPRKELKIKPPNWETAIFDIVGTSPLVICRFSAKAHRQIKEAQESGQQTRKGKKREAKNFQEAYEGAFYTAPDGWHGINALSFRNAMISACKTTGFFQSYAKISLFVEADGYDKEDGMPLVRITKGKPRYTEHPARNKSGGADLRVRPMWNEWGCKLRVRYDADLFTLEDIANLLMRAGIGGVGEGRYNSKDSAGMGWGMFEIAGTEAK